jgi:20S proteasome subunit alpha 3
VLAAEKKETSKLFVPLRESGKLYKVDEHIMAAVSGIVADANYLIDAGRLTAQQHLYSMHTPIYVEELVKDIANRKHMPTQFGSGRPFGVSLMYAGYDRIQGFQLYCSDPSGNYSSWNAHATGKNSVTTISTLKDDYKTACTLRESLILAVKVLAKSMDAMKPTADRFEIGVVTKDAHGNCVQRKVEGAELEQIILEAKIVEMKANDKK